MNSMTGFGRGIGESEIGCVTAEIKAVNSRFLEINIRSDHFSGSLEEIAREALRLASHKLPIKTKIVAADAAPEAEEAGE